MEDHPPLGRVYHVGNGDDMVKLLESEGGLAWTSHARIKGSSWTPDFFRNQPFYKSDLWLGAAWKAMPADLSLDKLGTRALNLLDDMANWGDKKYLPGEVDVFKIDHTHELYGHMNINYIVSSPTGSRGLMRAGSRCSIACAAADSSSPRARFSSPNSRLMGSRAGRASS